MNWREQRGLAVADRRAMTYDVDYPPSLCSRRSRRSGTCGGSGSRTTRYGSLHKASSPLLRAISLPASKVWRVHGKALMKLGVIRLDILRALFRGGPERLHGPVAVAAAKHDAPEKSSRESGRATLERMLEDACSRLGEGGCTAIGSMCRNKGKWGAL